MLPVSFFLSPSLAGCYWFSHYTCRFRSSTWQRLAELSVERLSLSELLDRSMRRDPLWPILTPAHLKAIDRRLGIITSAVQKCIEQYGRETVIVDNWPWTITSTFFFFHFSLLDIILLIFNFHSRVLWTLSLLLVQRWSAPLLWRAAWPVGACRKASLVSLRHCRWKRDSYNSLSLEDSSISAHGCCLIPAPKVRHTKHHIFTGIKALCRRTW